MAEMTEAQEERVAANRSKTRQNKDVPWLIRDDGVIRPNVPLIARKPNFRPYHGALDATLEERMNYLAGLSQHKRRQVVMSQPLEELPPLDLSTASKEELLEFAMEEFSEPIDPELSEAEVRVAIAKLAGIELPKAGAGATRQRKAAAAGGLSKA